MRKHRSSPAKLRPILLLGFLLVIIAGAQELRIHSVATIDSTVSFAVDGNPSSYYIVQHTKDAGKSWTPTAMELGLTGLNSFQLSATNEFEYFRVVEVSRANPKDTDGDGLDDLCELLHRPAFDPLVPQDPNRDYDQDGIPDIEECGNNWNPLSPDSPTPEEYGRKRGAVGPTIVGALINSQFGDNVGNIGKVISNTSISRNGTSVFISAAPRSEGGTNYIVHKLKVSLDGTVQEQILDQQADTFGIIAFGPNIEINQNDEVLVRRVVVVPTPLANILYSFLTRYDAFGNRVDLATGGSLKLISEFSDIQRDYCMNNVGDFATAANDWNAGRVIASGTSEFQAKTPLSETTPFSPMQCSDAHTLVIRTGDANGKIRLFGMPDLGNKPIFTASVANGFFDLGKRPGISYDGRMVVFHANYSGSGDFSNLTPGPGIFALVHTNAISAVNIEYARVVRIVGIAGNGFLEPGERWNDANTNGVVDVGEDLGRITSFIPDAQVSCANDGKIVFHCGTTAKEGNGVGTSLESIACTKLLSFLFPLAGRVSVPIRSGETTADGQPIGNVGLSSTIDRNEGDYLSALTLGRTDGERMIIIALPTIDLAVDADRNGTIDQVSSEDSTSAMAPFSFWLNDDIDRYHQDPGYSELEFDDIDPAETAREGWQPDWTYNQITSLRDLEDFSRIWISLHGLTDAVRDGDLHLGLRWSNTTGDPSIKLYPHVEADGGAKYLFDSSTAGVPLAQQSTTRAIADLRTGSSVTLLAPEHGMFVLPTSVFVNLTESTPVTHLLFEGCHAGTGQLQIVILKKDGSDYTEIGQGPGVWLALKEPREFVQRWSSGDEDRAAPQSWVRLNANSGTFGPPATAEEQDMILYVHGYNMNGGADLAGDKQRWLETTYKRLYWLGYKGRVGGFSWPCAIQGGFTDNKGFDDSEQRAWQSGTYLMQLLSSLKTAGYRVHVLAHSQGNVAAGEALLLWKALGNSTPLVSTYVASQGAIPAHCYDATLPNRTDFAPSAPNVYGRYWAGGDSATLPATWGTSNPSYLAPNSLQGAAGRFANFYNPDDYALTGNGLIGSEHPGWMIDQRLKPDVTYGYTSGDGFNVGHVPLRFPDDHYQIFSYAAPAWSFALGATSTGGVFSENSVNLKTSLTFGGEHLWHSGEFRSYNAARYQYWMSILDAALIPHLNP
jgi:hypothetical protein